MSLSKATPKQDPALRATWFNSVWFVLYNFIVTVGLFPLFWRVGVVFGELPIVGFAERIFACVLVSVGYAATSFILIGNGFVYFATKTGRFPIRQ